MNRRESPEQGKLGLFVTTISDKVLEQCKQLKHLARPTSNTRLAIMKSNKIRPRGLIRALDDFAAECEFSEMKGMLKRAAISVEDMFPGGDTRLFTYHCKENANSALEFVCLAVRKYRIETGEEAVDFCLATYSYTKKVNVAGVIVGISAFFFGGLLLCCGAGFAGAATALTGSYITKTAFDTTISNDMKTLIEASFIHELVDRGYAVLGGDRRLYITNE